MIKAVLLDFDGTLVTEDLLTFITETVGKGKESHELNIDFQTGVSKGLGGLIKRINLLSGVSLDQINKTLDQRDFLTPGAEALINFLRDNGIKTILASGNILPVLKYYQDRLQIDYIIGSRPRVENGVIEGITESDYSHADFKLFESQQILGDLKIEASEALAIGDSIGDKSRFMFAGKSIAFNPKGGIEELADFVIHDNLADAIQIIMRLNSG